MMGRRTGRPRPRGGPAPTGAQPRGTAHPLPRHSSREQQPTPAQRRRSAPAPHNISGPLAGGGGRRRRQERKHGDLGARVSGRPSGVYVITVFAGGRRVGRGLTGSCGLAARVCLGRRCGCQVWHGSVDKKHVGIAWCAGWRPSCRARCCGHAEMDPSGRRYV